jgi:copper chaperone
VSRATERTYNVEGMSCGHCELSVREEVEDVAGVTSVQADHSTGRVVVAGEDVDDEAVRAAIAEAGYRVAS